MMLASFRVLELQCVHVPVNGPFAAEQSRHLLSSMAIFVPHDRSAANDPFSFMD